MMAETSEGECFANLDQSLKAVRIYCENEDVLKYFKEMEVLNDEVFERSEEEVVSVVRKQLCPALRLLLEHGMLGNTTVLRSLPGLGCFSTKNKSKISSKPKPLEHIWDVVLFFYDSKNGKELSDAPVRKLSQSFKLEHVSGRIITSKQVFALINFCYIYIYIYIYIYNS
uniref:FH2 domain-containing protein n=1 Tax=Heterorhabditis bacteriophora TaxID=37862 RepID=A0A1I7X4H1_HETBA